ncbi:Integral membrane protein (PIN domain superfamily) [Legionella geestiana]|uniref:Integral membrane protein (PIN domain superfamily) n=1 Tax=Legionella geestiana TaxID=45065 RepID=A0A0W0U5A4_9GAMM|nr:hypothetical protein [Legionella geestiana]KTD02886.1 Integral membrane protein (PIN domain superfamily) [Legionella geestiana]QBS11677.1 hypothetical protein E4T54_02380 [Legionella geestiana]QDQ40712.1 hypothetical protein E3226_010040 [Legionella geestiana]STX53636.1 Integral membrane protein (PIN domain superfamily) [Legionella geestiana]
MEMPLLHTALIAQVSGLYLVIMAIILVTRADYYRGLWGKVKADSGVIVLTASIGLLIGLTIVALHTHWVWSPMALITLLGWFITLKSAWWLAFPEKALDCTTKAMSGPGYYATVAIIALVGLHLMALGFYHHL